MEHTMGRLRSFLDTVRHGQAAAQQHMRLDPEHVIHPETGQAGTPQPALESGAQYFSVLVNSMRLDYDRVGARTYDPMVVATTEFRYDGAIRKVPFVVSASRLAGAADGEPAGMVLANTRVAGPSPYYGDLAVTVILYKVVRDDYVARVLDAVQRTCAAFDLSGALSAYLKIGEAVLDSVDAILDRQDTEPVLGHRIQFQAGPVPGTFVVAPDALPESELWLADGDLKHGPAYAGAASLANTSYVVYTVTASDPVDLAALPWFAPLWKRIVQWADIPSDEAKGTAKAYLAALYEELATSPDVPRDAADAMYQTFEEKARNIHMSARRRAEWGPGEIRADAVRARALEIREAW
jgi:hypothetical protein